MDRVSKFLARLDRKHRFKLEAIIARLIRRDFAGLDIKKLKNQDNVFRVRVGNIRVIYSLDRDGQVVVKTVDFKGENTYRF